MKKLLILLSAALFCFSANAQRHTPIEIKQLAYRNLPRGQKPLGLDLDKYITSYLATNGGGGGGSVPDTVLAAAIYEEVTSSELGDLISAQGLTVGKKYLITDYKTRFLLNISSLPYEDANVEPLLVTALENDQLEPIAFSPAYPKDIIYYAAQGTSSYMPGSATGCIYRRIDTEKNISVPFDFREFKVEVAAFDLTAFSSGTYAKGQVFDSEGTVYISRRDANTEDVSNAAWWLNLGSTSNFRAPKPIDFYFGGTLALNTHSIAFTERCFNIENSYNFVITGQPTTISECLFMTFGYIQDCEFERLDNCYFNTEDELRNNKCGIVKDFVCVGAYFRDNNIGDMRGLLLGKNFQNNTVANGFEENAIFSADGNTFGKDAKYNILGMNFNNNTTEKDFKYNSIGESCGNDDGDNKGNYFGARTENNVIGDNCWSNRTGEFRNNDVGNNCKYNNLPFKFTGNTTGDDFQNWTGQAELSAANFSAVTTTVSDSKYLIQDNGLAGTRAGYFVNGVMTYQSF